MKNPEVFKAHVLSEYPREAVGIVVEDEYMPLANIASNPFHTFLVDQDTFLIYEGKIQAILHSHTYASVVEEDPRTPSRPDMILAKNTGAPQGIVHCDGTNISDILYFNTNEPPELLGRIYVSGVTDCFTLVRDYYIKEYDHFMDLMPRSSNWVDEDPTFLIENINSQGFKKVIKGAEQVGDVLVFAYGTRHHSHLGVYIGEGKFIHHLQKIPSCIDNLASYKTQHGATYRLASNGH